MADWGKTIWQQETQLNAIGQRSIYWWNATASKFELCMAQLHSVLYTSALDKIAGRTIAEVRRISRK